MSTIILFLTAATFYCHGAEETKEPEPSISVTGQSISMARQVTPLPDRIRAELSQPGVPVASERSVTTHHVVPGPDIGGGFAERSMRHYKTEIAYVAPDGLTHSTETMATCIKRLDPTVDVHLTPYMADAHLLRISDTMPEFDPSEIQTISFNICLTKYYFEKLTRSFGGRLFHSMLPFIDNFSKSMALLYTMQHSLYLSTYESARDLLLHKVIHKKHPCYTRYSRLSQNHESNGLNVLFKTIFPNLKLILFTGGGNCDSSIAGWSVFDTKRTPDNNIITNGDGSISYGDAAMAESNKIRDFLNLYKIEFRTQFERDY
jgi:hypothetical protein